MQLEFTDFQKDCLVKAKDHLNKIPRNENNVIRWNLMPGKVAVIVDFWKQSKLSAETFADALMITKTLLPKFARGRTSSNDKWPELLALLKPEEAEKNKVKKEKQKSEKVVEDAIFKVLLRDQVKEIGLRTETIAAEISSYPSRFVSTCLGRLERAGRLVKFKGEDKYTKWKVVDRNEKPNLKTAEGIHSIEMKITEPFIMIDSVVPEIKIVEEPKIQKIELPTSQISEEELEKEFRKQKDSANKIIDTQNFYQNLELENLDNMSMEYVTIRIPMSKVPQFSFPLDEWRLLLIKVYNTSPNLAPDFEEYWQTRKYLDMLKALEKAKLRMKLNSYQEVIDRFNLILDSVGIY